MERKQRDKLTLLGIASTVILVLIFISWPFRSVIAIALLLAFVLQYPTAWLERRIHRRRTSILVVLVLIFAGFAFILLDLVYILYNEVVSLSGSPASVDKLLNQGLQGLVPSVSTRIGQSFPATGLQGRIAQITATILDGLLTNATRVVGQILPNVPLYVVELIIITLLSYYLLLRGANAVLEFRTLVPQEYQGHMERFLAHLQKIYYSLYVVNIASSLVSGVFAAIGYAILGVPYFLTFAILIAIFGLIPVIGRAIIYVPLTVYYLLIGEPIRAIVLLAFSWAVLDQLTGLYILPLWAHRTGKVPQALTILAFTAPILALGPIGFIIGPATYGLALALYRTYREIQKEKLEQAGV